MAAKKFPYPIAYVVWIDAYEYNDWQSLESAAEYNACIVESVGFLLDEDDTHVTILQSKTETEAGSRLTVPKSYIKQYETLNGSKWTRII